MNTEFYKIPVDKLREGVSLCFRKSFAFTTTARTLFKKNKDYDIVASLLVTAIEELGKGLFLKEQYENKQSLVSRKLFGKGSGGSIHSDKIQKGLDELGEKSLIHPKHFKILSSKETKFHDNGSITYKGTQLSPTELHQMTMTGFGGYDSMVDYKTKLDHNKKFQLFYVDWNKDTQKWQYGMFHNEWQINNILNKLESFLKDFHNTDITYSFKYD